MINNLAHGTLGTMVQWQPKEVLLECNLQVNALTIFYNDDKINCKENRKQLELIVRQREREREGGVISREI